MKNGLNDDEIELLDQKEVMKLEPNVRCHEALLCKKDASVDYGYITQTLADQLLNNDHPVKVSRLSRFLNLKINKSSDVSGILEYFDENSDAIKQLEFDFLINASGSNALGILNKTEIDHNYQDLFFRGEYWIAPSKYSNLTQHSIYSIPEFTQFPFLDPHWIIRTNGNREVGPNACPVFSPYGYDKTSNLKALFPKLYEVVFGEHRINKSIVKKEMLDLVLKEASSSFSKRYMIKRVKKFLPVIEPREFTIRGTAGIRANLIDREGNFILNPVFKLQDNMLHILNYNSPGATGVFPIAFALVFKLADNGILKYRNNHWGKKNATRPLPFDQKLIENCREEIDIGFV